MSDLEKIPYTVFKEEVLEHNVKEIYSKGSSLTGNFINPVTMPSVETNVLKTDTTSVKVVHFTTELPSFIDPGLEALLIENGVTIRAEPIQEEKDPFLSFLMMFGPTLLIMAFYFSMYRRMQQGGGGGGGIMGMFGSSKVKRYEKGKSPEVTFNDVAGIDEAMNELKEIVDF
jgi:cell division protease FtsH